MTEKHEALLATLDQWMIMVLKINQAKTKNMDTTELEALEYEIQTEMTEQWMAINGEILKDFGLQIKK